MIDFLNFVLLAGFPWATGIVILYSVLYQPRQTSVGAHLLLVGAAVYVGYLFIVALMIAGLNQQFLTFPAWMAIATVTSFTACFGLRYVCRPKPVIGDFNLRVTPKDRPPLKVSLSHYILSGWLIAIICTVMHEVFYTPASSWDTVKYWSHFTGDLLQRYTEHSNHHVVPYGHPETVHLIQTYSAYAANQSGFSNFLYFPWFQLYLGLIIATFGTALALSNSLHVSIITAILLAANPLIEAHTVMAGYADIWLASGVFFATASAVLMTPKSPIRVFVFLSVIASSLAYIKSAGWLFTAVIASAVLLSKLQIRQKKLLFICVISLIFCGLALVILDWQLVSSITHLSGYSIAVDISFIKSALRNQARSTLIESSFAFMTPIAVVSIITITVTNLRTSSEIRLLLFLLILLTVLPVIMQVTSDYVRAYSSASNNTSLTRSMLPWLLTTTIGLSLVCRSLPASQNHSQT